MSTVDDAKAALGVDLPAQERALPEKRQGMHLGEPAYRQFSEEMIKLIGATIMPAGFKTAELYQVLELAATYKLDPFTRELWAVRYSRNADAGVQVVVGRDGMLAIAERHDDFLGFRNEAVHENDTFEILDEQANWRLPTKGGERVVPTQVRFKAGHPNDRGGLLGAFAEVYREGRAATFFWAPLSDYDKAGSSDKSPWLKQKNVMIEKVALVTALRHAYRISGLYIIEELQAGMVEQRTVSPDAEDESWWGDDEELAQRLRDLFDTLGGRYLPAKRRLLLQNLDHAGRLELADRLEEEIVAAGLTVPTPPEAAEGEVVDDEAPDPPAAEDDEFARAAEDVPFGDGPAPDSSGQERLVP